MCLNSECRQDIKDIKKSTAQTNERITAIETMLAERCKGRFDLIISLVKRVTKLEIRQAIIFGGLGILAAFIGWYARGIGEILK